jgi:hypothetical protein
MDHSLTPEENALIEDALGDIPLAPMPRSITANVMARIQKDARPALITWNDIALSLVIALCVGALFFAMQNLPSILLIKMRIQGILLYQNYLVNMHWFVPILLFGVASILCVPAIVYLQRDQSQ